MTLKFYDDGTGKSYTAMGVPGQLSTSNVTSSSADLTLPSGVTGAQYYELSESANGGSTWTVVDSAIAPSSIVSPATYSRSGLTSGATYQWRLRAKFASLVSPVYSAVRSASIGASTIFSEYFDSGVIPAQINAHSGQLVTNAPLTGHASSIRRNFLNGASDPYVTSSAVGISTGTAGTGSGPEYVGSELKNAAPQLLTIKFQFRFDDAWWKADSSGASGQYDAYHGDSADNTAHSTSNEVNLKGGYFGPYGAAQNGFYSGFFGTVSGGSSGGLFFADNDSTNNARGDSGWQTASWAQSDVTNTPRWYLSGTANYGSDGQWHEFKITIDRTNGIYGIVKLYIDNVQALFTSQKVDNSGANIASGEIRTPLTWVIENFSTAYVAHIGTIINSTNRTGTACGYQIGGIEILGGLQ